MAVSNGTRGICGGGYGPQGSAAYVNTIDYITFASTGNATDFGDLLYIQGFGSSTMSATRAVWFGGYGGTPGGSPAQGYKDWIQYQAMATLGNSVDWDNLNVARSMTTGGCSETRLVVGGGYNNLNDIDYKDIDSTGNASDFGNLTDARGYLAGASNGTRMCFAGGADSQVNTIDKVEIDTPANATDHGDLTINRSYGGGCSGAAA